MPQWFLYALLSAIFSAAAALSQKSVLKHIDAVSFSFFVSVANALLIGAYVTIYGLPFLGATEAFIFLGKTLLGAFAFLCVMISIRNFELSSVLPVLAFTPALVALAAFFFLGEKLSAIEITGMSFMLGGIYLLEVKEKKLLMPIKKLLTASESKYIVFALILFTFSSVIDKTLIGVYKIRPRDFIIWQQIFAPPIFAIIFAYFAKQGKTEIKFSAKIIYLIIAISVFTIAYRFLYVKSLQYGAVALALTVKRFSVFLAVLASGKLLNEKNIPRKAIATIIILTGSYLLLK
jgi:transporter family protein